MTNKFGKKGTSINIYWGCGAYRNPIAIVSKMITIYSEQEQRYIILNRGDDEMDQADGEQIELWVVDQDGDTGLIRVRAQKNSVLQLYVEFDNIMWVYSDLKPI